ncbi:MAG: DUF1289 domain-containing protein [Colwellia sp.]|nr:DUF1289 domain-containing protein [Colwellia sp.]
MSDNMQKENEVASPCIRNCCLNNEDICLGCFRHLNEIIGWQSASSEKKSVILTNCQQRREQSEVK